VDRGPPGARPGNNRRLDRCTRSPGRRQYPRATDCDTGADRRQCANGSGAVVRDAHGARGSGAPEAECHRGADADANVDAATGACRDLTAHTIYRAHAHDRSRVSSYTAPTDDTDGGGRPGAFTSRPAPECAVTVGEACTACSPSLGLSDRPDRPQVPPQPQSDCRRHDPRIGRGSSCLESRV